MQDLLAVLARKVVIEKLDLKQAFAFDRHFQQLGTVGLQPVACIFQGMEGAGVHQDRTLMAKLTKL